ncbi:BnaCnng35900D [Brassica napus]|uniref:BnaCnng35900D protein n=1 Tax=Brassica napus TaxID=3708 RepID=A0A078J315_BRANA|nr:BnaCnng35900D [Brassica napus]
MDGLRWFVVEMGLRLDKFSGPLRRSPSLTLAAVKKRILAFGRSVCEEETMKKKRFHNHIQWLESSKTDQDLVSEPKNTTQTKLDNSHHSRDQDGTQVKKDNNGCGGGNCCGVVFTGCFVARY